MAFLLRTRDCLIPLFRFSSGVDPTKVLELKESVTIENDCVLSPTPLTVEAALDMIGGKWKLIILFRVMEQTRRFNELQRLLPRITQGNNR